MTVRGIGRLLISPLSGGTDARETHLPVNPLARAAEFQLHCVVKAVQPHGRVQFVPLDQPSFQRLVVPVPTGRFVFEPVVIAAAGNV